MIPIFRSLLPLFLLLSLSSGVSAADAPPYLGPMRAAIEAIRTPATFPARIGVSVTGPDQGMITVEGGAMIPFDNRGPLDWRLAVDILGMYLNDGYAITRSLGVPFLKPVHIIPVLSDQGGSAGAGLKISTDPLTGRVTARTQFIVLNMAKLDPSIDDVRGAFIHESTHIHAECGNKSICDETLSQLVERRMGYERPLNAVAALFADVRTASGAIDPVRFNQEAVRFLTQGGNTRHDYAFGQVLGDVLAARFARPGDGGLRPVLDRILLARQAGDANRAAVALGFASSADFARAMLDGYRTMMRGVMADDRRAALFMGAMVDVTLHLQNPLASPRPPLTPPLTHGYSAPLITSSGSGFTPVLITPPLSTNPIPTLPAPFTTPLLAR